MEADHNKDSSKRRKTESDSAFTTVNVTQVEKWCHQCDHSDRKFMVKCQKCTTTFCVPCITKWYPDVSEEEFVKACPVCRDNCNCKKCFTSFSTKEYSCSELDKFRYSKYILENLFPLVRRLNEEQLTEKKIEAKYRGLALSELQLKDTQGVTDDDKFCDNCGGFVFDFYRSCVCGYDLCLACCKDWRDGHLPWKSDLGGVIVCPPKLIGGCASHVLELKRMMPADYVVKILEKAQKIYKINKCDKISKTFTKCFICYDSCNVARHKKSSARYLYSTSAKHIQPQETKHFQLHWSKSEPVVVSDVFSTSSGLSWEPMVLQQVFYEAIKKNKRSFDVTALDCLHWSMVTISFQKFLSGYLEGGFKGEGWHPILKLEDQKSSFSSQENSRLHFAEFISCLPFKDYTNPYNGYLNVAVKLPDLCSKPVMGPRMEIAYRDSVTKLHYDKSDTVNVLVNVQTRKKSAFHASTKLKSKMMKRKHGNLDKAVVYEKSLQKNKSQQRVDDLIDAGAVWDIFRRQDIPKLEKYLWNHSAEFKLANCLLVEQDDKEHSELNSDYKVDETANDDNLEQEMEPESVPYNIDCPDPEFSDFEKNRKEVSFNAGQIWACYDTKDAMPRCYAYIKKVVTPGFKLKIQWLKPNLNPNLSSPDEMKWVEADLPVSCGNFNRGKLDAAEDLLLFSHLVSFQAGHKAGTYWIVPRKGETWALFKNWSMNWHIDKERKFEYEFVEVLSDYDYIKGVRVSYLEKVKGFVCLFKPKENGETVIAGSDKYRFGHMIPSCKMSGEEKKGVPKGSFELDPAGLPLSTFRQVFHPIHDQTFYLNTEHKKKLKEEFGIEPWTFKQKMGDTVFIPAGCAYQVRNLKSNIKVRLNFISPENVDECIRLQHEIRMLPENHRAKREKLNIEKMMIYALDHALADLDSTGANDDLDFAKMPEILQGDNSNIPNHTNGWLNDIESIDNSHKTNSHSDGLNQEECGTSSSFDHTVNHEPATLQDSDETVGLWRGNPVGLAAKKLLDAVENHYPNTFQGVQTRFKSIWLSTLNEFHGIIKGFLETSVDKLTEEQITSLREDFNAFERSGFDLSWAHKRIDMVEKLKFGNEPLIQELMALDEPLEPLKEILVEKRKQFVQVREMLEKAELEYNTAKDARNNKAREVAENFGDEYDRVLNGQLGFGMLPGY